MANGEWRMENQDTMIKGLYHKLNHCQDALAAARRAMRDDPNPGAAHNAGVRASAIEQDIQRIKQTIDSNLLSIDHMEFLLGQLSIPSISSADRTLALRHIEDAQSRLLRELGDQPSSDLRL